MQTYANPETAEQFAANLAYTRGEAAAYAREARALDRHEHPFARRAALVRIADAQRRYPKLTPTTATFYATALDRPTWTPRDVTRARLAASLRAYAGA